MTSCLNCGEETDSYDWIGSYCDKPECDRAMRDELRGYQEELAEKARADGYERYR